MEDEDTLFTDNLLRLAHAAIIRYPHFKDLHSDIRQCQQLSKIAGEPKCMSLEGVSGAGKSTLVKEYAKAFPRIETPERTLVPIFYLETPSPVSIGGIVSAMLTSMGDPAADRGKVSALNTRLVKLIIACKVQLVILDDFHHLIDSKTDRVLEAVSDWLKVLIKETEVPFLVVGIEGKVERILKANTQLSRLFAVRETLKPFTWNAQKPSSIKEFAQFIKFAEEAIKMPLTHQVRRIELLYRVYYATDGVVANIMNLLRAAQLYAMRRNSTTIEVDDLYSAFHKHLAKHLYAKTNPFLFKDDSFALVGTGQAEESEVSGGKRPRKQRDKK